MGGRRLLERAWCEDAGVASTSVAAGAREQKMKTVKKQQATKRCWKELIL